MKDEYLKARIIPIPNVSDSDNVDAYADTEEHLNSVLKELKEYYITDVKIGSRIIVVTYLSKKKKYKHKDEDEEEEGVEQID